MATPARIQFVVGVPQTLTAQAFGDATPDTKVVFPADAVLAWTANDKDLVFKTPDKASTEAVVSKPQQNILIEFSAKGSGYSFTASRAADAVTPLPAGIHHVDFDVKAPAAKK